MIPPVNEQNAELAVFGRVGEAGLRRLVAAFYRRVQADDLLRPMYPEDDWDGAEARLAGFLIYRFGGPDTYLQERGHPRLGMRHRPFPITTAARDRWMQLMTAALVEAALDAEATDVIERFLGGTATFLINRPDA